MKRVRLFVSLFGGRFVSGFEGKITETNPGERRQFPVFLNFDGLFIEAFRFFGVTGGVIKIREGEESLGISGVAAEVIEESFESCPGILRLALVDLELGFAEHRVAGRRRSREADGDAVEGSDFFLTESSRVGVGGIELLLFFDLRGDEGSADRKRENRGSDEDLVPVAFNAIHDLGGVRSGEGFDFFRLPGWIIGWFFGTV